MTIPTSTTATSAPASAPSSAQTGRRIGGRVNVPVPTDNIPQRGNAFTRAISILLMRLTGWHFTGEHFPAEARKFVLIVAPHTSNWDFPIGVMAKYALGIRGAFLGKHTLFRFPLGLVMRWLGGLPVDRSSAHDVVTQTVHLVERSDRIIVVLSPEGTRKRTDRWRTGFWWIAHKAGIPILPVAFDYSRHAIHVFPLFQPTGDVDADVTALRKLFHASMAYDPAKYAE